MTKLEEPLDDLVRANRLLAGWRVGRVRLHQRVTSKHPDHFYFSRSLACGQARRRRPVRRKQSQGHQPAMGFKLPANERLRYVAGQYVDFLLKDGKRRSFSLTTPPHDDQPLELHIMHIPAGVFTDALSMSTAI
jgi:hypothetical protein